ncbi:MAG: glycoside hydrolase family 2 TIM barrel-domain containing protein, partial [Eubacteriales bacterium]|nr:glycoside hydrolase family 2 TIM barrel-domain containing protein [Eubacteriales bacterium]
TGVLGQGYWPDGLYTAPSDEAMAFDIASMKRMGFNMLRKHIKIEPLRWYYHCDVQGMLVWQDMVNGGGQYRFTTVTAPVMLGNRRKDNAYRAFSRTDEACREQYYSELEQTVRLLYNVPCVVCWVPFNEGWGQFDALEAEKRVRALDGTRLIDHASGWHDQGGGDMKSLHIYFKPIAFKPDERAIALTEFGGYNLALSGHVYNDADFGYHRCKTREQLAADVSRLYEKEVLPAIDKGLAAAVYTQLSDVEDEQNGLISYDRQVLKLNCELVKALNDACIRQGAGNNKQRLR